MSKFLVGIDLGGGMDGQLFMSPTDSTTTALITSARTSASSNLLVFTAPIEVVGDLTNGSAVISNIVTTNIVAGMQVYSASLLAQRAITVSSTTTNTVTLSSTAINTVAGELITFATSVQLKRLKESNTTGRNPAFHYTQNFMLDTFRTADNAGNASKVKSAVIANIGTLRKPLVKNGTGGTIYNTLVPLVGGGTRASVKSDVPAFLTSHNDQTSTWHSNSPEGASKGWGGGIADVLKLTLPVSLNRELLSISSSGSRNVFTAGSTVNPFGITPASLVLKSPGFDGFVNQESDPAAAALLKTYFFQAAQANGLTTNDFTESADPTVDLVEGFQTILSDVMEITNIPTTGIDWNITGSRSLSASSFCGQLRSLARMILAVNPNRGGLATRTGTTVTITTEITVGVANRTAASTTCEITATNHRLFTSNTATTNTTDSVIVLGSSNAIDTSIPTAGYKITLNPLEEDNKFTFTTTSTTALVNEPVTVRLKHNLTTANKVYIDAVGFDSSSPVDGYPILTVPDSTSFTIATTASGTFTPASLPCKFKLINLDKQVMYTNSAGFSWDTHPEAAHSQLGALNTSLQYFNSLVSRIVDADVVGFTISEFGRTLSTNAVGTDHGWGNTMMVFGKNVRGNMVYGAIPDFSKTGIDVVSNMFLPTISVYRYGATFAKWMGLTDAQILALFPDLVNWPLAERTLTFLDPLV